MINIRNLGNPKETHCIVVPMYNFSGARRPSEMQAHRMEEDREERREKYRGKIGRMM